ncbi:MAG: hypothetical protein IJ551_09400 [Prevotella sp.]|nr:hypothetical protein [Prevotella sp.]
MANTDFITQGLLNSFHDELRKGLQNGSVKVNHEEAKEAVVAALTEALESGEITPYQAEILSSWEEDYSEVQNQWDGTHRTTAGDDPIMTARGGVLQSVVAAEDFRCDALRTTAYNQLRLIGDGGAAKQIGSAWCFPVPHLQLGSFGDATYNNGMLFTGKPADYKGGAVFGGSDLQPTVRFVPLSSGEPTSASAGTVLTPQAVTYDDKTYHTYLTPGEGWLIVSGITWADTCAHIAWEDWYDKFIAPDDEEDTGDEIALSALFTAAPNGTGRFLTLGTLATRADRTSATQMRITDPIGRVASPEWTTEEVTSEGADETTYRHSLAISGMKSGGMAVVEGSDQVLTVEGTTVSYTSTAATPVAGAVRYERATEATATVTLQKTAYDLDDCGIEQKVNATGTAFFACSYAQNVADALSQIAKVKLDASMRVIAEALAQNRADIERLEAKVEHLTELLG